MIWRAASANRSAGALPTREVLEKIRGSGRGKGIGGNFCKSICARAVSAPPRVGFSPPPDLGGSLQIVLVYRFPNNIAILRIGRYAGTIPLVGVAMPFISRRAALSLASVDKAWLDQLAQSRTEPIAQVQRAQILLRYAEGQTISAVAQALHTNRPRVERCVAKALELGVRAALRDLPGRGRRRSMSDEDRTWVVDLACQKPKDLGYAQELWTTRLLAKHIRRHCVEAGHPQLQKVGRGTISKILAAHPVKPHKIQYYLERRDPEFKPKMTEVLHVYRDVELWRNGRQ